MSIRRMILLAGVSGLFLPAWIYSTPAPDCTQASFMPEKKDVLEDAGTVVLKVSNPGSTDRPRTVDYRTFDGTATAGVDYVPTSGTLSFSPSSKVRSIVITIIDDSKHEPNTQFHVELIPRPDSCIINLGGNATVTIKEDDPLPEAETPSSGDDPRPGAGGSGGHGPGSGGSGSGGSGTGTAGSSTSTPAGSFAPDPNETSFTNSNGVASGIPPVRPTSAALSVDESSGGVSWSALVGIALGAIALGGLWVGSASRRKAATPPQR